MKHCDGCEYLMCEENELPCLKCLELFLKDGILTNWRASV